MAPGFIGSISWLAKIPWAATMIFRNGIWIMIVGAFLPSFASSIPYLPASSCCCSIHGRAWAFHGAGTFIRLPPLKVSGGLVYYYFFGKGVCRIHDSKGDARI